MKLIEIVCIERKTFAVYFPQKYGRILTGKKTAIAPDYSEAIKVEAVGRSIYIAAVKVDVGDVIEAVREFFENEHHGALAIEGEDV